MSTSLSSAKNVSSQLIRLYLTHFHDLDQSMKPNGSKKKPGWLSHYNFMSLLNLPDQIRDFGPIRNRWEGGIRGEKFIQRVKPQIKSVNLKNFAWNLLVNLLQQRELFMLKTVGDNQSDDLEDDGNSELGDDVDFRSVTKYPSIADVIVEWTKKEPLSVVIANKGEKQGIYCCFSYGQKRLLGSFLG